MGKRCLLRVEEQRTHQSSQRNANARNLLTNNPLHRVKVLKSGSVEVNALFYEGKVKATIYWVVSMAIPVGKWVKNLCFIIFLKYFFPCR